MKENFENSKINISYLTKANKRKLLKKLVNLGFRGDIEYLVGSANYLYTLNTSINYGLNQSFFDSYPNKEISPHILLKSFKNKLK